MYNTNFNIIGLFCLALMLLSTGCENEPLPLDIPVDQVEFIGTGEINGSIISFEENTIMVTQSGESLGNPFYEGELFDQCDGDNTSGCVRSIKITIEDSTSLGLNNDGIPILLEPGVLPIKRQSSVLATSNSVCVSAMQGDTLFTIFGTIVTGEMQACLTSELPFPSFTSYEFFSLQNDTGLMRINQVAVGETFDGDLSYYYLQPICNVIQDSIFVSFELFGNSSFTLSDFTPNPGTSDPREVYAFALSGALGDSHSIFIEAIDPNTGNQLLYIYNLGMGAPGVGLLGNICNSGFNITLDSASVNITTGIVSIEYIDENGEVFNSRFSMDSGAEEFIIERTELNEPDAFGNETVLTEISFSAVLTNPNTLETRLFENMDMVFAFGY